MGRVLFAWLGRKLVARPFIGVATFVLLAILSSSLYRFDQANTVRLVLSVFLWLVSIGFLFGALSVKRHNDRVAEAKELGRVVPPPPRFAGPGFFLAFSCLLIICLLGAIGIYNLYNNKDRMEATGTVTSSVPHPDHDKRYQIEIEFEGDDVKHSSFLTEFSPMMPGEAVAVTYDPNDPTDIEQATSVFEVVMGFTLGSSLGGLCIFLSVQAWPQVVEPEFSDARLIGVNTWQKTMNVNLNNFDQRSLLFFSDERRLFIWDSGEMTIAAIGDWLESGGIPSSNAKATMVADLANVEKIETAAGKIKVRCSSNGETKKSSIALGRSAPIILKEIAQSLGWKFQEVLSDNGSEIEAVSATFNSSHAP